MISAATEGVRRISPTLVPVRDRGDRRNQQKFPDLETSDEETDPEGVGAPRSQRSPTPKPERLPEPDPDARIDIRVLSENGAEVEWTGLQSLPSTRENILLH